LAEAADAVFSERGLDVGVGEIAQRPGVGRGTLFRKLPVKAGSDRGDRGRANARRGAGRTRVAAERHGRRLERHLDLLRAAISTPAHPQLLRGSAPTVADLQALAPLPPAPKPAA
jgi:hypothetical protein